MVSAEHTKAQRISLVWRNCEEQLTPSQQHLIRNLPDGRQVLADTLEPFFNPCYLFNSFRLPLVVGAFLKLMQKSYTLNQRFFLHHL
jgi:hypothetical protein